MTATLPALLDHRARHTGVDALVCSGERVTFPELAAATRVAAARLHRAGIASGDRVGLLLPASVDAYALVLGAMRLGAVPVPVNVRYKARELRYVVGHSGMRLLVALPSFGGLIEEAGVRTIARVVLGTRAADFVAADDGLEAPTPELGPDDDALILYTSGTTANPKGAVHRHGAVVAEGEGMAERMRLAAGDVFWTPLPFFHVGGIATVAGTVAAGIPSVQQAFFEPGEALELLEQERCTVAFPAFETIWLAVLNHARFSEADLSALRLVINVGVRSSLEAMQARLPQAPQVSCFGSTETCGFACIGEADDPIETRLTTSGRPLRGVEIRVADPESGTDRERGEVGELLVRGPTRFVRYHEDPGETARVVDEDGWLHTGDLGSVDAAGRVSFTGRLKEMLKVGGENVAAAEVESFLLTHPATEIVQVVGVPDARYVEVPAAFVQLRPRAVASEQELIEYCLGQIATFKVPRYVRFVTEWPMSGTKIQKFRLREQLVAELAEAGITEAAKPGSASGN
jgi:fatty-acyl-CoA synthase